jgi:hypothetical protein
MNKAGRPANGWVKVCIKLSPEAAALLAQVARGQKSAVVDAAIKAALGGQP